MNDYAISLRVYAKTNVSGQTFGYELTRSFRLPFAPPMNGTWHLSSDEFDDFECKTVWYDLSSHEFYVDVVDPLWRPRTKTDVVLLVEHLCTQGWVVDDFYQPEFTPKMVVEPWVKRKYPTETACTKETP